MDNNGGHASDAFEAFEGARIDPIGLSMLLSVFNTAVKTLGGIVEYGPASADNREAQRRFRLIRGEILNLHNSLDDFVLLVERFVNESDNAEFGERRPTFSDTMMILRERNYQRWRAIQEAIQSIDQRIYDLLKEIRSLGVEYMLDTQGEGLVDTELIQQFDSVVLEMGQMTFVTLIRKLRDVLTSLERSLARLAHMERV